MNKTELIAAVAQKSDLTKKDAEKAVKAVFEAISDSLTQGDKVQIIGFGTFEVRQRKAREGRNPRQRTDSDRSIQDPGFQSWQTAQRFGQQQIRYDSEGPHEKRPFSFLANCRTIVV